MGLPPAVLHNIPANHDGSDISYDNTTSGLSAEDVQAALDEISAAAVSDHGGLTGLIDDDHTQYALLLGRSGGQTLIGSTVASEDLVLQSTSDATRGLIKLESVAWDETNLRLDYETALGATRGIETGGRTYSTTYHDSGDLVVHAVAGKVANPSQGTHFRQTGYNTFWEISGGGDGNGTGGGYIRLYGRDHSAGSKQGFAYIASSNHANAAADGKSNIVFDMRNTNSRTEFWDNGTRVSYVDQAGAYIFDDGSFNGTLDTTTLSADRTYTLPDAGGTVALLSGSFTAGSVAFSDGTTLVEDNSNLFFDDTNNRLIVGANTSFESTAGLTVEGNLDVIHTAAENDDHALEIACDAAGFGDVKALDIHFTTGAIAAGEDEGVILVNIDESAATGGHVTAFEVIATEGSADVYGVESSVLVNPLIQLSGTFGDMDSALVNAVDRLTEFTSTGSDITLFVADNDTVTIGNAAKFQEIEFLLATVASGAGIAPTFEYSTGVDTWATFSPVDGTNGMRNSGVILWLNGDIPGWAVGTGSEFLIRITRTRNSLTTSPVEDLVQIATAVEFKWDKLGDVSINDLVTAGTCTVNGDSTVYRNDAAVDSQFIIEQDSTGDATMSWLLTAGQEYRAFIDNSVSDTFILRDETNTTNFLEYVPGTNALTLGVTGAIELGDSTQISMRPAQDGKVDLGEEALRFGKAFFDDLVDCEAGIITAVSTNNVSNPPTDAQLDTAFGTPAALGAGFIGVLDDNNAETNTYLVYTTTTKWWILTGTVAV